MSLNGMNLKTGALMRASSIPKGLYGEKQRAEYSKPLFDVFFDQVSDSQCYSELFTHEFVGKLLASSLAAFMNALSPRAILRNSAMGRA